MATAVETRIFRLAGLAALVTLAALIVPRFLPSGEGGLAAAATAVLVFLALLLAATIIAAMALVVAVRAYASLSWPARAAGIAPAVLLGVALLVIVVLLRY